MLTSTFLQLCASELFPTLCPQISWGEEMEKEQTEWTREQGTLVYKETHLCHSSDPGYSYIEEFMKYQLRVAYKYDHPV